MIYAPTPEGHQLLCLITRRVLDRNLDEIVARGHRVQTEIDLVRATGAWQLPPARRQSSGRYARAARPLAPASPSRGRKH